MDGIHDMGGMHGFGKVEPEKDEPVFHAPGKDVPRAQSCHGRDRRLDHRRRPRRHRNAAAGRLSRRARITANGRCGWKTWCVARGLVGADELAAGHALHAAKPLKRKLDRGRRPQRRSTRGSFGRQASAPARLGRRSRARKKHPSGDTHPAAALRARPRRHDRSDPRLPCISGLDGGRRRRKSAMAVHRAVRCRELWGETADPTLKVSIEAFEPYLEAA